MKKIISILLILAASALFCACGGGKPAADDTTAPDADAVTTADEGSAAPAETTAPDDGKTVLHFIAAGDNVMHSSVLADAASRATAAAVAGQSYGRYYFDSMYAPVAPIISGADIAFINQEAPIAGDAFGITGYPNFNAPSETADTLERLGFDIVNIANNHMLDMDTAYRGTGYLNTINFWKTRPVTVIGGYENAADYDNIRTYEAQGIKIALLSYTYGINPGNTLNPGSPDLVVPLINDADIQRQMPLASAAGDLVFVSVHWGTENTFTPTAEQHRVAQLLCDLGADVIIGHHSHTVQPVEWLTAADGHRTLVIYSLGNFISTMLYPYNMVGIIAGFDIVREQGGEPYIDSPVMTPVVTHYTADAAVLDEQNFPTRSGVTVYPLADYTEELATQHGTQLYQPFTLATLRSYITDTISSEFLPASFAG